MIVNRKIQPRDNKSQQPRRLRSATRLPLHAAIVVSVVAALLVIVDQPSHWARAFAMEKYDERRCNSYNAIKQPYPYAVSG